jgi:hypothetical protein
MVLLVWGVVSEGLYWALGGRTEPTVVASVEMWRRDSSIEGRPWSGRALMAIAKDRTDSPADCLGSGTCRVRCSSLAPARLAEAALVGSR